MTDTFASTDGIVDKGGKDITVFVAEEMIGAAIPDALKAPVDVLMFVAEEAYTCYDESGNAITDEQMISDNFKMISNSTVLSDMDCQVLNLV